MVVITKNRRKKSKLLVTRKNTKKTNRKTSKKVIRKTVGGSRKGFNKRRVSKTDVKKTRTSKKKHVAKSTKKSRKLSSKKKRKHGKKVSKLRGKKKGGSRKKRTLKKIQKGGTPEENNILDQIYNIKDYINQLRQEKKETEDLIRNYDTTPFYYGKKKPDKLDTDASKIDQEINNQQFSIEQLKRDYLDLYGPVDLDRLNGLYRTGGLPFSITKNHIMQAIKNTKKLHKTNNNSVSFLLNEYLTTDLSEAFRKSLIDFDLINKRDQIGRKPITREELKTQILERQQREHDYQGDRRRPPPQRDESPPPRRYYPPPHQHQETYQQSRRETNRRPPPPQREPYREPERYDSPPPRIHQQQQQHHHQQHPHQHHQQQHHHQWDMEAEEAEEIERNRRQAQEEAWLQERWQQEQWEKRDRQREDREIWEAESRQAEDTDRWKREGRERGGPQRHTYKKTGQWRKGFEGQRARTKERKAARGYEGPRR